MMYTQAIGNYGAYGQNDVPPPPPNGPPPTLDPVACANDGGTWDHVTNECVYPGMQPNGNNNLPEWMPEDPAYQEMLKWRARAYWVIRPAAVINGLYHGLKRNNSVGWALAWGFFATCLPVTSAICSVAMKPGWAKTKPGR